MTRLRLVLLLALALLWLGAAPADAHTQLEGTSPPAGATLAAVPETVELRFTGAVEVSFGAVRVFDATGTPLMTERARHATGRSDAVIVDLPELDRGSYAVLWRVVSSDGHPINGAFTFRVDVGTDTGAAPPIAPGMIPAMLAAEGGSRAVGVLYGVVRFLGFAALITLIGGAAFALTLSLSDSSASRVRRTIAFAWIATIVTTVAAIALQGVYVAALPLARVASWSVSAEVLDTRYGRASAARIALVVLAAPLLLVASKRRSKPIVAALALIGLGLVATPGLAGHPGSESPIWLALGLDAVHFAAVCAWLGGLVVLSVVVLRRSQSVGSASLIVSQFSRAATWLVLIILVTGVAQGWRQSRSVDAVTDTTFGRLLLVKLGLFAVMLGLAAMSRRWLRQRAEVGGRPDLSGLRRSVVAEAAIGAVVLAATALLVNAPPARTALLQPVEVTLEARDLLVNVTVDPANAGPVDLHIYTLTPAGAPTDVQDASAKFSLAEKNIAALVVPIERAGPGHFVAYDFELPLRGLWKLDITARSKAVGEARASATVRIR